MSRTVRVERLVGRVVRDAAGRRVGRIREMIAEVAAAGSGEYVVRQIHLTTGGLVETLGGAHLARILADRLGWRRNRIIVDWKELDLSDPERPVLRGDATARTAEPRR